MPARAPGATRAARCRGRGGTEARDRIGIARRAVVQAIVRSEDASAAGRDRQADQQIARVHRCQAGGVISVGKARCGKARPACEVGDGKLTAVELRNRLLLGAKSTGGGTAPGGLAPQPRLADEHWANEGYGTYYARLKQDDALWLKEQSQFTGPLLGTRAALKRPADEKAWFLVDSWCRQHIFGSWSGGTYKEGRDTLPGPDPAAAPVRTAYGVACNALMPVPPTPRP